MQNLREAAQQALEALVWTTGSADFGEGGKAHEGALNLLFPAIIALRDALAEDAMQRLTNEQQKINDHLRDATKMIEPVAWVYTDARGKTVLVSANTAPYDDAKPLYPAPPKRKPLTDEDIDVLRQGEQRLNFVTLREFRVIARAIERAHGIGGKE